MIDEFMNYRNRVNMTQAIYACSAHMHCPKAMIDEFMNYYS